MKKNVLNVVMLGVSLLILNNIGYSQNRANCRKVIELTMKAVDLNSSQIIKEHCAEDFTMAGHSGAIGKLILDQMLNQLDENVKSFKEVSVEELENELHFKYDIVYEKMGTKKLFLLSIKRIK